METEKVRETPTTPPLTPQSPATPPSSPPPPSLTSSPAHEFTFTISLHPPTPLSSAASAALKLTKPSAPNRDIDLSPADEIFFHGHLLPLHISHRHSNVSIETEQKQSTNPAATSSGNPATVTAGSVGSEDFKDRTKPKSFSSIFAVRKWLRGSEDNDAGEKHRSVKKKKMLHIIRLWKKYASLVEPLLFFKSSKEKREVRRSSYSFSGISNPREGGWRRRWRGEFSAPASMRTSPANSGLLVAPPSAFSSSDESTMEELQNAIQAAIAHCKNSIAAKEENCC